MTDPAPNRRALRAVTRLLPVVLPLALLVLTGFRGIDFGVHWDERSQHLVRIQHMVDTGTLLPGAYNYPSVCYWLELVGLVPEVPGALAGEGLSEGAAGRLREAAGSQRYLLRLRGLFLCATALAVLWTYLLVLAWRDSWYEALLAATFLAGSWEVAYHARWVAPDGLLMQAGILTLLLAYLAWRAGPGSRWILAAAAAAGLACGTKYPGGALLVPVLATAAGATRPAGPRDLAGRLLPPLAVFVVVYLITTPGTLLQPVAFLRYLHYELVHYGDAGHGGYTVAGPLDHGLRLLTYWGLALFSRWAAVAAGLFLLTLVGGVALRRDPDRFWAAVFLLFPILYTAFFLTQKVMIVRNLLVVAPFLAILAARGAATLLAALPRSRPRRIGAAVLAAAVALNGAWLLDAGRRTARRADREGFAREAASWVVSKGSTVYLAPRLRARLGPLLAEAGGASLQADLETADLVLLDASEGFGGDRRAWPANDPFLTVRTFGPAEVRFDYYPTWRGDDRILALTGARARGYGVLQGSD